MVYVQLRNRLEVPLIITLIIIGLTILISTPFGKPVVKTVTDMMYILVTITFIILAGGLVLRFKKTGNHGKAWILFLGTAVAWFLAETTWAIYELVYHQDIPFPSLADLFYVIGYPLMFGFLVYYLQPVKKAITKKMIIIAILISLPIAVPSMIMAYSAEPTVTLLENALATGYPILDAIIFVPSIIGLSLFFRGQVNFTWSLIFIGIICLAIGDFGFQFTTFTNTYYTGHPVDIILMWSYIFFLFGAYDHIRLFSKKN